jgi:AraC family transcriptional regulator
LVYESASRTVEADLEPGSVIVTGRDPISWLRVREATEAVEIYPDEQLLQSIAPGAEIEPAAAGWDGTVLAMASILKRVHLTGSTLSDIAASTLAHKLAGHVVDRYSAAPAITRVATGRLDRATVDRVTAFVDAELSEALTLDRIAAVAMLSPFYFARAFKLTTGMAPHQFVTARRMHRATTLLVESAVPVEQVAQAVGLSNVSYFRRKFRDHMGVLPGALRQDGKIGASAARRPISTISPGRWP